jgi:hypothetical protein
MGIFASEIFLLDIPFKRSCRPAMTILNFRGVNDPAEND